MYDYLSPLSCFLVPIFLFWRHALRRVDCPDCGAPLPAFMSPFRKTRRMWRAGGYLCARCGCETDMAGRKVADDTPLPPFPTGQWVAIGVLLLIGLLLAWVGLVAIPDFYRPVQVAVPKQAPPPVLGN